MDNFEQRYEALMNRLSELPVQIQEQEEVVELCRQALTQADATVESIEAGLMQAVQGSNAEQRKAALTLTKQTNRQYVAAEANRRDDQEALATALAEQRRLENQFRAVCYQAMLTAAFWQMPGLKLTGRANGYAALEETVDAFGDALGL